MVNKGGRVEMRTQKGRGGGEKVGRGNKEALYKIRRERRIQGATT